MNVRKFVVGAGLAGLLAFGVSSVSPVLAKSQSENNQQSVNAMSATGKVAAIGSDHKSFSLQTSGGDTMQFVLDQNTQVTGRVSTGTNATVQYQKTDDGKLLALVIAPQSSGSGDNGGGNPQ